MVGCRSIGTHLRTNYRVRPQLSDAFANCRRHGIVILSHFKRPGPHAHERVGGRARRPFVAGRRREADDGEVTGGIEGKGERRAACVECPCAGGLIVSDGGIALLRGDRRRFNSAASHEECEEQKDARRADRSACHAGAACRTAWVGPAAEQKAAWAYG